MSFDEEAGVRSRGWVKTGRLARLAVAVVAVAVPTARHGLAQENVVSLTLQGAEAVNRHTSEEDVAAGGRSFQRSCALCHGGDARGGLGPDLTRGAFRHGDSDAAIFRNILTGIPGTDMPGVYRPDTDIWQLVSYVRSLSAGGGELEVAGDPRAGAMLYRTLGECSGCHRIDGRGGLLGPDLSDIGWIRSPQHIEASLVRPSEAVDPDYRMVMVELEDGTEVVGLLRNEDRSSLQMLDNTGRLRAFRKRDLRRISKPTESLMPSFEDRYSPSELQNMVAYLYSLKGGS